MTGPMLTATERAAVEEWLRSPETQHRLAEALIRPLEKRGVNFQGPPPDERDVDAVAREVLEALRDER